MSNFHNSSLMILVVCLLATDSVLGVEVDFGARLGMDVASFRGDDTEDLEFFVSRQLPGLGTLLVGGELKARAGFTAAAFVEIGLHEAFAVQPEFGVSSRGAVYELSVLGNVSETEFKLVYLDIPLLLKLRLPTAGGVTPALFAGPHLSVLAGAESENETDEHDIKDDMAEVDYGFTAGSGAGIEVPFGFIIVDFRFSMGFVEVFEDFDDEIFNYAFLLSAGFALSR